jgi:hypothetical protein
LRVLLPRNIARFHRTGQRGAAEISVRPGDALNPFVGHPEYLHGQLLCHFDSLAATLLGNVKDFSPIAG